MGAYSNAFLTNITCAFLWLLFHAAGAIQEVHGLVDGKTAVLVLAVPAVSWIQKAELEFLGKSRKEGAGICYQQMGSEETKITKHGKSKRIAHLEV